MKTTSCLVLLSLILIGCSKPERAPERVESVEGQGITNQQVQQIRKGLQSDHPVAQLRALEMLESMPGLVDQHQELVQRLATEGSSSKVRQKAEELAANVE